MEGFLKAKATDFLSLTETKVEKKHYIKIGKEIFSLPSEHNFHRKTVKLFDERIKMLESNKIDWGIAELLAYASLLKEDFNIRISGQDVEREGHFHIAMP